MCEGVYPLQMHESRANNKKRNEVEGHDEGTLLFLLSQQLMAAVAFAILGKSSEPLYVREFVDERDAGVVPVSDEELFGLPPRFDDSSSSAVPAASAGAVGSCDCSVRLQFILHAAVDRFDELAGSSGYAWRAPGDTGTDAMFVGLLKPVDNLRVYGYMTTTQIRFLLVVEDHHVLTAAPGRDQRSVDGAIYRLFVKLHRLYVEHTLNPFGSLSGPIQSAKMDQRVHECVAAFNRSIIE